MSPRVLVVDDNLSNRKMLSRLLEVEGFIVDRAGDARTAIELAQATPPDIVLQDLALPDMDGLALGRALRALGLVDTPFIVISGFISRFPDVLRDPARYSAVIAKPIDFDEVLGHIRDLLEAKLGSMRPAESRPDTAAQELSTSEVAALARRNQAQHERIGLLANLSAVIPLDHNEDDALRDVLSACVEASSAKTGALYLCSGEGLQCRAHSDEPEGLTHRAATFYGHPARFEALMRDAALATRLSQHSSHDRTILEAARAAYAIFIPISRDGRNVGALFLAGDASFEPDIVPFARALGAHMIALLSLAQAFGAVTDSDARYRAILAQSGSGIIITNASGRIIEANPAATRILGAPIEQLVNERLQRYINNIPRPDELAMEPRHAPWTADLRSKTREGRVLEVIASTIAHQGEQSMLVFIYDITDAQRLRQQVIFQEKLATIGTLAASVAHEINNPMTSVLHNLEIIEARLRDAARGLNAEGVADCLQVVNDARDGIDRVRDMAGVLQGYARPDGDPTLFDVTKALDDALRLLGGGLYHQVRVERHYDTVPSLIGRPGKLAQVFTNLLVNALHALTSSSEPCLFLRVRVVADNAVIDIRDNGCGISPQDLGRIFEPYYTTKPEGVGTGLGLPICRQIVNEHSGSISASCQPSVGTTFTVVLPLPTAEALQAFAARTPSLRAPSPTSSAPPERVRILLVDDEPHLLGPLARLLTSQYEVHTAKSGAQAWAMIEEAATEDPFDLVLTDIAMPDVDGIQLYERVLTHHPRLASRLIFSTGGALTPRAESFLAAWHGPTLRKPYPIKAVRDLVATVLLEAESGK